MNYHKAFVFIAAAAIGLQGCANMSKEQQALWGAAAGCTVGALIGGLAGGGKGAAIGCGAGGVVAGAATYAFASDPFTQSTVQSGQAWQQEMGSEYKVVKANQVVDNSGQKRDQVEEMHIVVPKEKMEQKQHLSSNAQKMLTKTVNEAKQAGGGVMVLCPGSAPPAVVGELMKTGATVAQDQSVAGGYVMKVSRSSKNGVNT